jgi:hypothetical protein
MSANKEKVILIGAIGQVGRVIFKNMCKKYEILEHDIRPKKIKFNEKDIDLVVPIIPENFGLIMHVCIPFTPDFISIVKKYNETYKPKLVIIHSNVELNTTKTLIENQVPCVHSPILFDENIFETAVYFKKMIGYDIAELALMAEEHLRPIFNTALIRNSAHTELASILHGLYEMSCRAMTFEMNVIFNLLGLNHNILNEFIHYSNVGYASFNKCSNFLQNITTPLNRKDYRLELSKLLPDKLVSLFFKLATKSYDLEKEFKEKEKQEKLKGRNNEEPAKI